MITTASCSSTLAQQSVASHEGSTSTTITTAPQQQHQKDGHQFKLHLPPPRVCLLV
jgi:hypothetical protein